MVKSAKRVLSFVLVLILAALLASCEGSMFNEEDEVVQNHPPYQPSNPYPEDGAKDVPLNVTFTWEASDPDDDPLSFDFYISTNYDDVYYKYSSARKAADLGNEYFSYTGLEGGKTYYWRVVAKDPGGLSTDGPIWEFTTEQTQEITVKWSKAFGGEDTSEWFRAIAPTSDGGFIAAGYKDSNWYDFWVVKIDGDGNLEWEKTFGESGNDRAYDVIQTRNGGYVVVGCKESDDYGWDFWVIKLDSDGNKEWEKTYGGSHDDVARAVKQTSDGGYIVVGYTYSDDGDVSGNYGRYDFWVVKLDGEGNLEWEKTYGGSDDDEAYDAVQTSDGGYIVVGNTYSSERSYDFWVVKLDSGGDVLWQKVLGGRGYDEARAVLESSDGYVVVGFSDSNDGDVGENKGLDDIWVVKLDGSGNILWKKVIGGSGTDEAFDLCQTSDGYVIVGWTTSDDGDVDCNHGYEDYLVAKLSLSGDLEWVKTFGGSSYDEGYAITTTSDGVFVLAGNTESDDGDVSGYHGKDDGWILKIGW